MRRREFHAPESLGRQLFAEATELHLAGVDAENQPVFRTFDGVVEDGWICFHASPAGEKTSLLGRPVVLSVEEVVARLPSYFVDPQKACPATTLYRSAQVHGVLTAIEDPARKARVLQRLMEKLQPEGGYVPLDHQSPLYKAQIRGLLIGGVPLDGVTTKAKLAQNKTAAERVMIIERLWQRGLPGDARALELVRAANPGTPTPSFLAAPEGLTLRAWLPGERAEEAAALLEGTYWNVGIAPDELVRAHRGSSAWIGVEDESGALVGTARAISDGAKFAWVYDVCVRPDWRGRGVGQAMMRLMLDHPAVRGCRAIRLGTKDAETLYRKFGFIRLDELPPRGFQTVEMIRKAR